MSNWGFRWRSAGRKVQEATTRRPAPAQPQPAAQPRSEMTPGQRSRMALLRETDQRQMREREEQQRQMGGRKRLLPSEQLKLETDHDVEGLLKRPIASGPVSQERRAEQTERTAVEEGQRRRVEELALQQGKSPAEAKAEARAYNVKQTRPDRSFLEEISAPFEFERKHIQPYTRPVGEFLGEEAIKMITPHIPGEGVLERMGINVPQIPGRERLRNIAKGAGGTVAAETLLPSNLIPLPIIDPAVAKLVGLVGRGVFGNRVSQAVLKAAIEKGTRLLRTGEVSGPEARELARFVDEAGELIKVGGGAERLPPPDIPEPEVPRFGRPEPEVPRVGEPPGGMPPREPRLPSELAQPETPVAAATGEAVPPGGSAL